ncbi:MAG: hypothetical protein ACP5XB_24200 [Isosphaeraceae bacterium]
MNRLQRAAILVELADRLLQHGSWCGETHLQKSVYILQELFRVPTDFEFIFYKFGPYSFDLSEDLTALRADYLVELRIRRPSYGPSLVPTQTSQEFRKRYPVTLGKYSEQLEFIARALGQKGVSELERVSTALFVSREPGSDQSVEGRARRVVALKPHVSLSQAIDAVRELDRIVQMAGAVTVGPGT